MTERVYLRFHNGKFYAYYEGGRNGLYTGLNSFHALVGLEAWNGKCVKKHKAQKRFDNLANVLKGMNFS